jgi:phosphoglycolate phosphatase
MSGVEGNERGRRSGPLQGKFDLVVFDLDGTLVDSHQDLAKAANVLVRELGGTPISEQAVVRMVGEGAAVLVRRALTASGLNPETPGALDRFLALYDTCLLDQTRPYPGMVDVLERLAARCRLAVLTNKPARATTKILEGLDLARFFDPVIGGDTPLGRKPDPAGMRHIIAVADASPESTLLVGDSPVDRQTARNAKTAICLARFGFGYTFEEGDLDGNEVIVDAPHEIGAVLGF